MQTRRCSKPNSAPCRPLRVERDDVLLFITNRTVEERFWLHPLLSCGITPPNRAGRRAVCGLQRHAKKRYARLAVLANARKKPYAPRLTANAIERMAKGLVGSALARAQKNSGAEVFAFVALSNHVHVVIRTPKKNAHAFVRDFKSLVARGINRITGRSGPLWARRADIQHILDDRSAAKRVAYTVANPVKARLVHEPEQWPGLNLAFGLTDADTLDFEYFDTPGWHAAGRPQELSPHYKAATLRLSPLPAHAELSRDAYAAAVRAWVAELLDADEPSHELDPQRPRGYAPSHLGVTAVVVAAFEQRPKQPHDSPRPYCFGSPERVQAYQAQMDALHTRYAQASRAYRAGRRTVVFPAGMYPPPVLAAAA